MKAVNYTKFQIELEDKLGELLSVDLWNGSMNLVGSIRQIPIWRNMEELDSPELLRHAVFYRY